MCYRGGMNQPVAIFLKVNGDILSNIREQWYKVSSFSIFHQTNCLKLYTLFQLRLPLVFEFNKNLMTNFSRPLFPIINPHCLLKIGEKSDFTTF